MASTGVLLVTLIFTLTCPAYSKTFVTVRCEPKTTGQYDQQTRLDCVIQTSQEVRDAQIKVVTWKKEGVEDPILFYNRGELRLSPGYSFAEQSWNKTNMNVSLLIHKTAVKDESDYTCVVSTDSGYGQGRTSLEVTAKYRVPTIEPNPLKIDRRTDGTLTCKSEGYPKGELQWFDKDGHKWTQKPVTEVLRTESGLFSLSSTLQIQRNSDFFEFTCKVLNAAGDTEAEGSFTVPDLPPEHGGQVGKSRPGATGSPTALATKIVAPVVVIGSLIVGLLLLLLYKRRSQQARRLSAAPLMSGHQTGLQRKIGFEDYPEKEDGQSQGLMA